MTAFVAMASQGSAQVKAIAPAGAAPGEVVTAEVIRLSVDPAPEPTPAFKYRLLPAAREKQPGNAAQFYYRALLHFDSLRVQSAGGSPTLEQQLNDWADLPPSELPRDQVRDAIRQCSHVFDELKAAAYREECNWDWRLHDLEGTKGIEFLLRETQDSRALARALAVKAKLEILERRYDDAVETLRIGFQLARDVAKPPTLITGLVGIAIASIMNEQLLALSDSPGSPNLYWAITEFPSPFIDLRGAVEYELDFPMRVFPYLKDPEHARHSAEQWADLTFQSFDTTVNSLVGGRSATTAAWQGRLAVTALAMNGYPAAKRDLIEAGYDRARLEAMPVGQVLAIHEAWLCRYIGDEMRKWTLVPYHEALDRFEQVEMKLNEERYFGDWLSGREIVPIAQTLMPAVGASVKAMIRRDIDIAAGRVIEAIRLHAAQNGGTLPRTLSEIKTVSVPHHPRTGQPFPYRVERNTALLEVRRTTGPSQPFDRVDRIFEITINDRRGGVGNEPK